MKLFGKEFAPQELLLGAAANIVLFAVAPWYVAVAGCVISSLLWMCGGTFAKGIRRFGVPAVFAAALTAAPVDMWSVAALVAGIAWLHQGDGFPDHRPTTKDKGSWLGRLVEKVFPADAVGGPITKVLSCVIYALTTLLYLL